MLYFAYGSNLHPVRLRRRVPSSRALGAAWVDGYRLRFHKRGADGSGKCTLVFTGASSDRVFGALYRIDPAERGLLDRAEGLGAGYSHQALAPIAAEGRHRAFAYIAQAGWIDAALAPLDWYQALVVEGARRHGLPAHWIECLRGVAAVPDGDLARAALHWRLVDARLEDEDC